jgi:hypothetical protein
MLKPTFLLTKKVPVILKRRAQGSYVDGDWVEGGTSDVTIDANVQPVKPHELMQFPESERSKEWLKIYSADEIRSQVEGVGGWDADEFQWESMEDGKLYTFKVMKVYRFKMGVLDHHKGWAARTEITPN